MGGFKKKKKKKKKKTTNECSITMTIRRKIKNSLKYDDQKSFSAKMDLLQRLIWRRRPGFAVEQWQSKASSGNAPSA